MPRRAKIYFTPGFNAWDHADLLFSMYFDEVMLIPITQFKHIKQSDEIYHATLVQKSDAMGKYLKMIKQHNNICIGIHEIDVGKKEREALIEKEIELIRYSIKQTEELYGQANS